MNKFQRIKNVLFGVFMLLFALAFLLVPKESYEAVAAIIAILLIVYGFRMLWYYFTMARHMVGGKTSLYQAVIILDLALFTGSMAAMSSFAVLFYLLGVFAFTGFVGILRAFEAKKVGASWKTKFITGCISVVLAIVMLLLGVIFDNKDILVYGFAASLIYAGVMRIVTAFKKTAIVYIQ